MKIRTDIPAPDSTRRAGRKPTYPFLDMEVGASFPVDDEKLLAVRTAVWRQNKGDRKFIVDRHRNKGWRCWRTA